MSLITSTPVRFGSMNCARVDILVNAGEILRLSFIPETAAFLYAIIMGDVTPDVFRLSCFGNKDFKPFDVIVGESQVVFPWMLDYALVTNEDPLVFVLTNLDTAPHRFEMSIVYAAESKERAREIHKRRRA